RRTRGGGTGPALRRRQPAAGAHVRLPFFSGDLLEDVDLEVSVRDHLLQPAVFLLELPEPFHVARLQAAEVFAPGVDRLRAHTVLLRHLRDRFLVGLPQDRDHLLVGESRLLHGSLSGPRAPFSQVSAGPKFAGQVRTYTDGAGTPHRVAVSIGPEHGTV